MIYQIFKTLHIIGFITAIGISLSTLLAYNQFWKLYIINRESGLSAFRSFKLLQIAGMIGLALVLVAGICMLAVSDWAFMKVMWFHIKLGLIVLLLINGFTLGRISTLQLQSFLSGGFITPGNSEVQRLRSSLNTFQIIQLCIYILIIILSVFRFW